ncbi:inositol monophosphatase family protein [Blastopirellula retiformator]|uniref:Inositol-1-monophosphatase n=1 Tax=Blastopirellula retiformator TaxID=2527970 RepID=A0A5C5UUQ2_9BACT|nr:inositol monophosphatase family protein [Blastopirellula retiformator]TWT29519.1 Inositol-1-monophosphatase [Blastopirellula retiformator]
MSDYLTTCEKAARAAGAVLLEWQGKFRVREKGRADLVTEADVESQKKIQEIVLGEFPEHGFLGEEEDPANAVSSQYEYRWIADPLDGTTNYVHGLANYSVSLALQHRGEVIVGVVYDPVHDQCFAAERGQGATLNGEKLQVSDVTDLEAALVAASFAAGIQRDSPEIEQFIEVLVRCQAMRRLGSAALNLAYVAAGTLDAYWASSVKIWDVAAGVLLVQEAGGVIRGPGGEPFDWNRPKVVAASTEQLHDQLQASIGA